LSSGEGWDNNASGHGPDQSAIIALSTLSGR
jgi:hypothetical protein